MKNIFLCLTKANTTLKTGGGDSQIFKHFWQYAACLFLAFVLGIGQMWADVYVLCKASSDASSQNSAAYNAYTTSSATWMSNGSTSFTNKTSADGFSFNGFSDAGLYWKNNATWTTSSGTGVRLRAFKYEKNKTYTISWTNSSLSFSKLTFIGRADSDASNAVVSLTVSNGTSSQTVEFTKQKTEIETKEVTLNFTSTNGITITTTNETQTKNILALIMLTPAASGPSISSFSPATGATVGASQTITITGSTGSTVYYKWATSAQTADAIYNSGSGSHGSANAGSATTTVVSDQTLYAIARTGTTNSSVSYASYTIDATAPTLSESTPANNATNVGTSGNIKLTFNENVTVNDASKFSISPSAGVTLSTPTVSGAVVTIPYSGLLEGTEYTFSTAAGAVKDAAGNTSAALSDITFTTGRCEVTSCGNASLTYAINASTDVTNTAANLLVAASTVASNTTALGISTTAALSTISINDSDNKGKAAAATNSCFAEKQTMSSKIGMYNGSSYSSSNYLQFTFTVKEGYTFTPCDIQFVVQPVSAGGSFRWEVTDGSSSYGYGTGSAPVGSGNGATVLTGLSSTSEMSAGTYYIRLYPYHNGGNTFRISNDVILRGTTAEAVAPTGYAITKSETNGTIAVTDGADAISSADEDDVVYIAATPNTGYGFTSWSVFKTGDTETTVSLAADDDDDNTTRKFSMPAYDVTVGATFTAINYTVTHSAATNGSYTIKVGTADAVSTNTTAQYGQTVTLAALPNPGYGFSGWTVMQGETPVSVTNNTFTMPAGNVTISAAFVVEPNVYYYKNASRYDGETYKNPEGNDAGSDDNTALTTPWTICNACVTGVTKVEATAARYDGKGDHMNAYIKLRQKDNGKIVFTIDDDYKATIKIKMGGYDGANTNITMKLNDSGDNIAYSGTMGGAGTTENGYAELTYANLAAGAYTLKPTSGSLYISQIDIQTTPIYTVTHTLTGATTSSATKVSAGEEYSATYTAETGYSLPASIMVKVGGSTIDAENYTWNQSTGALIIPAAQVTGNIQIIIAGEFTCPEAASGDVVFSWTPKTSLSDADIAAGTYDLPGTWLESVYGGSAEIYVNANEAMRIRNNQLAFNGNNAYVHLTICALAEGDRILVNSSNETNARNLWISLSTTRPADAEAAAAVIEQGKAYYISSTSPLKGATDLYIWRKESTTQIGEVSIIRSEKFTVTYAASDLTGGEVPAAVTDIFDGQTITVAGKGTMEKGTMLFNGWKDANEVSYAAGVDLEVTANMTLTAQWSQLYSVTYAKAGTEEGTVPTQESLLNGAQFTVADQGSLVTPANKVFGGWNDGTQTYEAGETYTIDGADVTLTAVWNNSYTVQYDANGGEGTMADGTGTIVSIAANDFTYADHKFLRWNSQPDGEGANYAVGAEVSENLTLYAIWKEVICPSSGVIYSLAMKTGLANESVAHGQELPLTSEYATITGGEATLRNNDGSGDDKAQIYKSEVYFNGANAYLKVDMDCGPLAVGDEIVVTSENYENELYLTNTNNTSEKIETVSRSYTIVANDLLEGKSIFYIWRKSGGTSVGTITITRPAPDAPVPTISNATPADAEYTGAASAMTVSADAEAPKALHYQWYKEAGETDIEVGTDAASYTPTASGQYYCVVTNSPDGYTPKSATSRTATITMISSDATLAWLKADGNDIALSDGVYAYEYVIADNATVAPTITAGENEENATVTITQADSKTGTATIHVVAQDGETSHDYTVKFNEFSGCLTTFYFPYATDADNNHVTNNAQLRGHTVFTNVQSDGSGNGGTLTVNEVDYTVTRSTSSISSFGKLVVPEKYTATLYLLVKIGSANTSLQLVKDGESTPYMSSDVYAETGTYQYNFENIQAGTYVIRAWRNGNVQNCNYLAMAAELCRYEVSSVSLANMILRTGNTATPEMTITPVKGAVVSQAWSFVDAATAEAAGLSINATTGAITATEDATPGAYTVKVVLNGDNTLSATCTVTVLTEYSQVDVTGTTEWDFATGKAASARIDIGYGDKLLANVDGVTNDETFNSQALMVDANYVSNSQLQSKSVMFHATVPGLLTIRYACTSGKDADRVLYINDRETTSKTKTTSVIEYTQVVPAGDVTIKAMFGETPEVDIMNYKYIKFTAASELDPTKAEESTLGGYERTVNPQYYGTVCLPKAGVMTGAMLFQVAYMDYKEDGVTPYKVYYDQVENGVMQAGMPYIFLAEQSTIGVYYTGTAEETAKDHNGLHGTLTDITEGMNATGIYMLYNNQVLHSTNPASYLNANRAYIQISEIPGYNDPDYVAPAPKHRRISTGFNGANTATGVENIQSGAVQSAKVLINGKMYILRGEKMYDATGRLVK